MHECRILIGRQQNRASAKMPGCPKSRGGPIWQAHRFQVWAMMTYVRIFSIRIPGMFTGMQTPPTPLHVQSDPLILTTRSRMPQSALITRWLGLCRVPRNAAPGPTRQTHARIITDQVQRYAVLFRHFSRITTSLGCSTRCIKYYLTS